VVAISLFSKVAFGGPAYWGGTGLLEIPNGRVVEDGEARFGLSNLYPYNTYYASLGFLPGLELNGRIVEILTHDLSETPGWEGYGYLKDRVVDLKLGVLKERGPFPAISLGAQDITGTKLFSSSYIAATKRYGPLDLTIGYGNGRLAGMFGGVEIGVGSFSLIAEHNPIDYTKDKIRAVEEVHSNLGYSLRYRPFRWLCLDLSYQRGREFGGMLNLSFLFGKRLVPWRPDPPYTRPIKRSPPKEAVDRVKEALLTQGFMGVDVLYEGGELFVEYENRRYLSEFKALGRVMRTAVCLCPKGTSRVTILAKNGDLPVLRIKVRPDDFLDFARGRIKKDEFIGAIDVSIAKERRRGGWKRRVEWGLKPTLEPYINDPSRFFMSRFGVDGWLTLGLWRGATLYSWAKLPVYSDITTELPPISDEPVRSDVVEYREVVSPRVQRFTFDQIFRIGGWFGLFSVGYLEEMFAGARQEFLYPVGDGRLAIGIEATQVTKRKPNDSFNLEGFSTHTVLGTINYMLPKIDLLLKVKWGRFLGGDHGARFEIKRYFGNAAVGFWYTPTDMEDYVGGKRYHDKGISITIPMNLFTPYDSKTIYSYSLSPWTRDGGKMLWYGSLYDSIYRFYPLHLKEDAEELLR
jgi:hypothetical protein